MKEWMEPEIEEISISETFYGGKPSMDFDNSFYDENGVLHVNFQVEKMS